MVTQTCTGTHYPSVPEQRRAPEPGTGRPIQGGRPATASSTRSHSGAAYGPGLPPALARAHQAALATYVADASWPRNRIPRISGTDARASHSAVSRGATVAVEQSAARARHQLARAAWVCPTGRAGAVASSLAKSATALAAIVAWSYLAASGNTYAEIFAIFGAPTLCAIGVAARFRRHTGPVHGYRTAESRSVSAIIGEAGRHPEFSTANKAWFIHTSAQSLRAQAATSATSTPSAPCGRKPLSLSFPTEMAAASSLHLCKVFSLGESWVILQDG